MSSLEAFEVLDVRVGTVVAAEPFPKARKPAYRLTIDFGEELGLKKSSAQITVHYSPEQLVGTQVVAVVNFPPKRIADFTSEVLVLGFADQNGDVVLARPEKGVPDGARLF